jgi:hypothetical protein
VPHNALFVYDVGHPTGKETERVGHPIKPPHLTSLIAEQGEGQIVPCGEFLCESTESELIPMTSASSLSNSS